MARMGQILPVVVTTTLSFAATSSLLPNNAVEAKSPDTVIAQAAKPQATKPAPASAASASKSLYEALEARFATSAIAKVDRTAA
jgi:hypothetical protein